MQQAEVADLRRLPQEGEPDHVLQGLPAGHVRVPDRELLLRVVHRLRARVQEAGHSVAPLEKIDQMSNRLGPVFGIRNTARPAFPLIPSSTFFLPILDLEMRQKLEKGLERLGERERKRERQSTLSRIPTDRRGISRCPSSPDGISFAKFFASHRLSRGSSVQPNPTNAIARIPHGDGSSLVAIAP